MTSTFEVKEFAQETWADFETLFDKHKGVRGGCWCTFHLCTSTQYNQMTREARKEYQRSMAYQGCGCGLIVYDEGAPVAWCQFGPAARFPRYDRGRAYKELALPAALSPQWRIMCLFVDKHRRGEKLSRFALKAALESIHQQGGGIVEAFPLDVPGIIRPQYTGSIKMYAQEGFQMVARLGKDTVLMRLIV